MKKNSMLFTADIVLFFVVFVFMFCSNALMTSCAAPTKRAKTAAEKSSGAIQNSDRSHKYKQTVEQRLDKLSIRLERVEQALGLDESQEVAQNSKTDASQDNENFDNGEAIGESDITEGNLPSVNSEDIFSPDSSNEADTIASKSDEIYQKDHTVSQRTSGTKPEALYSKARSLLVNNKFQAAEKEFRVLAQNYPNHSLAVNSYYWMGECRYSAKDYKGAIAIFKELVEKYPNGRKVPDALLKTAYSYLSIKDIQNGREYLKKVIKQFPFTSAGEKAEQRLQSIK
ncbi:MAG: tol-pal system protein YbgF [Desulfamplus sp.]|nr:tol-pal system protein YbgF [Desulfamplus sp.]